MKKAETALKLFNQFTDFINENPDLEPKDLKILQGHQKAYAEKYAEATEGEPELLLELGLPIPLNNSLK